ncbi:hypothetical protein QFC22_004537 [Naganishia vaughanmartiniae]|uniref:Uncharacterized protein n=1 Tax=Naganishia vaughanmartiniae TaxID=1424756 RepID=A0ACC2X0F0_9TREE|nr:hypothetical protein QFC22_004537 [Naganishia vaughanmartiniae]
MVYATKKEGKAVLPSNSYLIKAIKQGNIFPEEQILFSYSANNVDVYHETSQTPFEVPNAALPSPLRATEPGRANAEVQGDVDVYNPLCLDEAMFVVGGPAVALKLVELASSPEELQSAITLLAECVKESWKASEEAERMRAYDILAGLLRLKMQDCMTLSVFKTLYHFLGINFEKAEHSTVFNSTAYKALALRFDLWARAPIEVLELYFAHFQHLLTVSRFKRFNVLHCLKKAGLVRKLLHALKANTFDSILNPQIIETLRIVLSNHWSIQDSAKPILSYLIASLCLNSATNNPMTNAGAHPSSTQATALSIYRILAQILEDPPHLMKLVAALPLHRVLIVILSSNPFTETVSTSFAIYRSAIAHSPDEQFEKKFSAEPKDAISQARNKRVFAIIFATLERLLQSSEEDTPVTPKPAYTRTRSSTSHISLPLVLVDEDDESTSSEKALESLLEAINDGMAHYPHFRDMISRDQVEAIVPTLADYISMSAVPVTVSKALLNNREQVEILLVSHVGTTGDPDPFAEAMGEAAKQAVEVAIAKNDIKHETHPPRAPDEDGDDDSEDTLVDVPEDDGKKRRIAGMLATGDAVEENISRVVGVDSLPGLLIIGKQNLYLFDGLAKTTSGEIIAADEAPADLFSIPSGTIAQVDVDDMQSHRWSYAEIVESNKRWYLFRDVAIEFLFADKRNFLCVLRNKKERQAVLQRISGKNDPNAIKQTALGTFLLDTVQRAMEKAGNELDSVTRRWQTREISNFAYLQVLNQFANRTPNDVTQYPVFPWVVADYTSPILNLAKPTTFRDLTLPMGALTPARREAATERYQQTESTGDPPFQFDRLFSSVAKAWASASEDNRGDALESDYVSRHIPAWIDLVFGCKQHDKDSFTCYHPLSYKNAIDLDAIENEAEKAASVGIIHNFGQTPYQIFKEPHPFRYMGGKTTLPVETRFGIAEHWPVLMRSALPVTESAFPIKTIVASISLESPPTVLPKNRIPFPEALNVNLHFGNLDKSIRKYHVSGRALNGSTAAIANTQFTIDALLRGHEGRIHHLAGSDTWSALVSCGDDGTAIVWDMNRKRFLHRLLVYPEEPIKCAAISETEGHIALMTDTHLHTYTLNGAHIASATFPPVAPATFSFGGAQQEQKKPTFCGGVSFFHREFSKDGLLFAVGLNNSVSLWRLCPGTFGEPAWSLKEQKRYPGPEGTWTVTAVRFIE